MVTTTVNVDGEYFGRKFDIELTRNSNDGESACLMIEATDMAGENEGSEQSLILKLDFKELRWLRDQIDIILNS